MINRNFGKVAAIAMAAAITIGTTGCGRTSAQDNTSPSVTFTQTTVSTDTNSAAAAGNTPKAQSGKNSTGKQSNSGKQTSSQNSASGKQQRTSSNTSGKQQGKSGNASGKQQNKNGETVNHVTKNVENHYHTENYYTTNNKTDASSTQNIDVTENVDVNQNFVSVDEEYNIVSVDEENNSVSVSEENNFVSVDEENNFVSVDEENNFVSVSEENNIASGSVETSSDIGIDDIDGQDEISTSPSYPEEDYDLIQDGDDFYVPYESGDVCDDPYFDYEPVENYDDPYFDYDVVEDYDDTNSDYEPTENYDDQYLDYEPAEEFEDSFESDEDIASESRTEDVSLDVSSYGLTSGYWLLGMHQSEIIEFSADGTVYLSGVATLDNGSWSFRIDDPIVLGAYSIDGAVLTLSLGSETVSMRYVDVYTGYDSLETEDARASWDYAAQEMGSFDSSFFYETAYVCSDSADEVHSLVRVGQIN